MFEIGSRPRLKLPLAVLIGMLLLTPKASFSQARQWEQLMDQGEEAQITGDIYAAENHFRKALEVTRQFPAQDLRRSTTQRNLAQVLAIQGRHTDADTLYRAAIRIALLSLDAAHPYVLSLQDELAQLRQAEIDDEAQAVEPPPSEAPLADFLYRLEKWLADNTTVQLGASLPLIGELQPSNEQGFFYGIDFRILHFTLGALSTAIRLEFNSTSLPAKHSLDEPLKLEGPAVALSPSVGPINLSLGAGYYNVYTSYERQTQLAMFGGAGSEIWKKRRGGRSHLKIVLHVRATQLTKPVADLTAAPMILQAMLTLGPR